MIDGAIIYLLAGLLGFTILETRLIRSRKKKQLLNQKLTMEYTPQTWQPLIEVLADQHIPQLDVPYLMEWITLESDGNPCAIGDPVNGEGSNFPQEMGIMQVYNPDYISILGFDPAELRAYCGANFSQSVTRILTQDEMMYQGNLLIKLVDYCVTESNQYMMQASIAWGINTQDYWKAVKLWHALPGLVKGFPFVTQKLGRPPVDWKECIATLNTFGPNYGGQVDNPTDAQVRAYNRAWTAFNNANSCGNAFSGAKTV
jgi:hypothetical protein